MPKLSSLKKLSWTLYDSWRVSPIHCPALKKDVFFTLKGWNHLIKPGGMKKRSPGDLYRRLKSLPLVLNLIESSHTYQNLKEGKNCTYYVLEAIVSVKEKGLAKTKKLKVVLLEDRAGKVRFLSVMANSKK